MLLTSYLETRQKDANLGEILRRHGVHLNDLRRIEAVVGRAALEALKVRRNGNGPAAVGTGEYDALVEELARKEQALSELMVEYTLLKKKRALGFEGSLGGTHVHGERRQALMAIMEEAMEAGMTGQAVCGGRHQ